jgi:hypothetical protein
VWGQVWLVLLLEQKYNSDIERQEMLFLLEYYQEFDIGKLKFSKVACQMVLYKIRGR